MFLKPEAVVPVPEVPVGSFFYMKQQNGDLERAFMAQQTARRPNEFTGPVVLRLPSTGGFTLPRPAAALPLAVALVVPEVAPHVDLDAIESSSTESFGLRPGRMLVAGNEFMVVVDRGELRQDNYVSLTTGELILNGTPGPWLSFGRWELRFEEGAAFYSYEVPSGA